MCQDKLILVFLEHQNNLNNDQASEYLVHAVKPSVGRASEDCYCQENIMSLQSDSIKSLIEDLTNLRCKS